MIALLFQAMPTEADDPWVWIAGVMTLALGTLFWQLLKAQEARITSCEKDKMVCLDANKGQIAATSALTAEVKAGGELSRRNQETIISRLDTLDPDTPRARSTRR